LAQAGLPTPRNSRISAPEDVQAAADHVGFPSVIKPVSGAASIGVIRVNDLQQLQKAYERVVRDLSRCKVSSSSACIEDLIDAL
jgi:carnosine synthase